MIRSFCRVRCDGHDCQKYHVQMTMTMTLTKGGVVDEIHREKKEKRIMVLLRLHQYVLPLLPLLLLLLLPTVVVGFLGCSEGDYDFGLVFD